jgi:hypothetical protein
MRNDGSDHGRSPGKDREYVEQLNLLENPIRPGAPCYFSDPCAERSRQRETAEDFEVAYSIGLYMRNSSDEAIARVHTYARLGALPVGEGDLPRIAPEESPFVLALSIDLQLPLVTVGVDLSTAGVGVHGSCCNTGPGVSAMFSTVAPPDGYYTYRHGSICFGGCFGGSAAAGGRASPQAGFGSPGVSGGYGEGYMIRW